jgi:cytochrome c oxidase cbb3-type subunit 1
MVGFLFKVYGADRRPLALWCRPVLWVWSAALAVGTYSWLSGYSSGKLFLDWSGYARVLFPLAMLALWLLLAVAFVREWKAATIYARGAKAAGLLLLLIVPFILFFASSPNYYPAINPDTGGPTGASQLESSLIIVAILLMLPFGLARRKAERSKAIAISWAIMVAEFLLCFVLGRADISHHRPAQFLSLGSLLIWIPLTPAYYAAFNWNANTRRWRIAFLCWWAALVLSGWVLFLPGILDHFKFTDGLVGHSLLAMAGFTSSLLIFVLVQLLGEDGWIFNRTRSFYGWNVAVLGYVMLMTAAGWREGFDPTFTILPGVARHVIYILRLVVGGVMLAASLDWLIDAATLLRESSVVHATQEATS